MATWVTPSREVTHWMGKERKIATELSVKAIKTIEII